MYLEIGRGRSKQSYGYNSKAGQRPHQSAFIHQRQQFDRKAIQQEGSYDIDKVPV